MNMKPNILVITLAAFTAISSAQTPAGTKPAFEAASIKMSSINDGSDSDFSLGRVHMQGTVRAIIRVAYSVSSDRIEGGPKWLDDEHYEITAKAEGPAESDELRMMLQTLLADRFGLQFHRVTKTVSGYSLTINNGGLKISEVAPGDSHSTSGGRGSLSAKNVQIARLADRLSNLLGSAVVDQTGNSGFFNFDLSWSPEKTSPSPSASGGDDNRPSLFTALQEQLGLKLESRKVPVEFIVIDRVDKPSLN